MFIHRNTASFASDETGAAMVWSIFWTIAFLLIAGLVIDTSNAYRHKAALTATADASALAAIIAYTEADKFDDVFGTQPTPPATASERGKMAGNLLASRNMDPSRNGTVTPQSEVTMGNWDGTTFVAEANFTTGMTVNAARVRALRTETNNNPLNLLLVDMLGESSTWDVGATAIAMTFVPPNCPTKEGIMAGGTLNFASNNIFQGDLCLHGELAIDFNNNGEWQVNSAGDYPVVSYGINGELCKGWGNCQTSAPYSNVIPFQSTTYPLTLDMIAGEQTYMPDVPQIYSYYAAAATNPSAHTAAGAAENRYIPDALVTNPGRDPDTEAAVLVTPLTQAELAALTLPTGATASVSGGVVRIDIDAADFESAVNNAGGQSCTGNGRNRVCTPVSDTPFPPNSVIDIDGGYASSCSATGGNKITLTGAGILENLVISTSCRVEFNGTNSIAGTTVLSSYAGNNAALKGNSGAILGDGTCDDDSRGATLVTAGEVHFAAGVQVNSSRIMSLGDIHVSANGNGMRGTQVMTAGNGHFTSNSGWAGCPSGLASSAADVDHYYQLVY